MVIKIPSEDTEFRQLANSFYQYHYPNFIGAIDGSGIDITAQLMISSTISPENTGHLSISRPYVTAGTDFGTLTLVTLKDAMTPTFFIVHHLGKRC